MAIDSVSTASTPITPVCNLITHAARQSRKKPAPFSTQIPTFSSHVPPCFFKKPYRTPSSHCPAPDHCTCVSPQVAPECTYTPKRSPKELPRQIRDRQRLRQDYRHGKRHEHTHGQHRIRARMQPYEAALRSISYTSHRNHLRSGSDGHRTYHNAKIPPTQIRQRDFVISVQRSVLLSFNYFRFFKALMIRVAKSSVGSISRIF